MNFPSFQDFLKDLAPETTEAIFSDAKAKSKILDNAGLGEKITAISWTISLELLALYHTWLQDHLKDT